MGRLGTDPVTDLVTRPVVTECDVGQPGSRAAGPDRVETNAPPDRREGTGLCIEIPVCAVVGVLLVTESPADVVSMLPGLGWLVLFGRGAQGSAEDRSLCAVGSGGLVPAGPGGREPATDAEPCQGGAPLLGARGVDAADLDRFAVVVRMGGSLGDVVKTLVRLSP